MSRPQSVPELLLRAVGRHPEAEALVEGRQRWCYRTLWEKVAAAAKLLEAYGLGAGERVLLFKENSLAYVVAYYAVLLAGGVVVPVNAQAKARELLTALSHSEANFLVADLEHSAVTFAQAAAPQVRFIDCGQLLEAPPASTDDFPKLTANQSAAIVYTSGTTGRPKGVLLSHGNLVSNTLAVAGYLRLTAADRIVNLLPFQFAYGNSVLHTHLAVGGCVVIENNFVYPHRVLALMEAEGATGFAGVPATYSLLLTRTRLETFSLPALRYLTQAGGPMPTPHIQQLRQHLPHAAFYVMYGQTEATARLCYLPPERLDEKLGSVGRPIEGVEISIRDDNGEPLLLGERGEVWARGAGIMQGYWRDPVGTGATLVDGWLRTGDLGYLDADGFLYLEGRVSEMIKSGAYRIAPQEIEEVLIELEGVAEATAIGVPDPILGQTIKVFIIPVPGAGVDERKIRAHCRRHLAPYKQPKWVQFAAELPRTRTGKVQRHRLRMDVTD
ncbi:hypothetical protein CAI21_19920 [Alkalilimnicola ehrlichii]|uniref:AMP-dependent synthetase n=1 Tax=Alkalilimnicola ehrlichii TaxID=351052 RepID=A0A3E0WJI1_9GAMM|nr:AMP-binding protein [Alkalilimnicola ehrlichii]RFA25162.1 hypothetical protein CAI21_19920 [Alkalilimnicola ehrlichii]RFA32116.1 hypothetical protein CAL65_20500 [Alkalilimnicola ehrlichii]